MMRIFRTSFLPLFLVLSFFVGETAGQDWAAEAAVFNTLSGLCDGGMSFDSTTVSLNGKGKIVNYFVSQASFGSGVETKKDLVEIESTAVLELTNFATLFQSIYDVVVTFSPVEANAHKDALDATIAALQSVVDQSDLTIYENAESQGGNIEQLFIYDQGADTFGRIELSCG